MLIKFKSYLPKIVINFFVILTVLGINSLQVNAQYLTSDEQDNVQVYENVVQSIVAIDVDIPDGVSSGTGCIIDPKGIILTSSHVIETPGKIDVTLSNGKKYAGKLIAITSENSDLALIKIEPESSLHTIRLGDSTKIKVGQKVLAIGNPFGFNNTLTLV